MFQLEINHDYANLPIIKSNNFFPCEGRRTKTENFFGDIVVMLETEFPKVTNYESAKANFSVNIISAFLKPQNSSKEPSKKIWGINEYGDTLMKIYDFIDNRTIIYPDTKEIDRLRLSNNMSNTFIASDFLDLSQGMFFTDLNNIFEVVIASLYFYAYYDYKLVRCAHCGKWFATKSLKKKYCDRISPCFGTLITGKEKLTCYDSVQNIKQKCTRIKNRIETKASSAINSLTGNNNFNTWFPSECEKYLIENSNRAKPDAENLIAYYNFLKETDKQRKWILKDK